MSSTQPAAEMMEPSQQMTQSTYQASAASNVGGGSSGSGSTLTGQSQAAGYVSQQALPAAQQQQQTFNPNSRFVHCVNNTSKISCYPSPMTAGKVLLFDHRCLWQVFIAVFVTP